MNRINLYTALFFSLTWGLSSCAWSQNTISLIEGTKIDRHYIEQIDSFCIANGKTNDSIEILCENVSGLIWEAGQFSIIEPFSDYNLGNHPRPLFLNESDKLVLLRINSDEIISGLIMNDELYLYEKETLIYLYDILELDDEYAFLDSVLPSSFEQDSIFIMEIIDRESGKKYYYDVSICNSNKLEVEEFNNPANRILENKDLINIERIRKQNYFPVVMLHSMLFEKDETVQFMILDAKGMVCSGKYR